MQAGSAPAALCLPGSFPFISSPCTMHALHLRPLYAAVLFALVAVPAFLAGCDSSNPSVDDASFGDADASAVRGGLPEVTLSGALDGTRALSNDTLYILNGIVSVPSGSQIQIEEGTRIEGSTNQPSALLVRQGGRIEANGTQANPIVFTSRRPAGQRLPGDWGGVIIIGRSTCNGQGNNDCNVEGLPAPFNNLTYGGNPVITNDDSGTLRYVRIEFAGFELTPTREINGLTLYSVGSGTEIEYVQVHKGSDDGFEFFGGTFDAKYLLATGNQDDSFDFSYGYNGRLQFLITQQDVASGDRGFEVDNNEIQNGSTNFLNTPLTDPTVYNITAVGRIPAAAGLDNTGLKLRRGAGGSYNNLIIGGYRSFFLDVDDQATFDNCDSGDLSIRGGIGALSGISPIAPGTPLSCVAAASFSSSNPRLVNPISRTNPDFRPRNTSLVTSSRLVQTPPNDGFFTPVNFVGALEPNVGPSQAWTFGWTAYPQN